MAVDETALNELSELLAPIKLSAPSNTKFRPVSSWLADRIGLSQPQVCVFYVSKAGNLKVRFQQPGVMKNRPIVGLALFTDADEAERARDPARDLLVEGGILRLIAICLRGSDGSWRISSVCARQDHGVDPTLAGLAEEDVVREVDVGPSLALPAAAQTEKLDPPVDEQYDLGKFTEETGISKDDAEDWMERLRRKGQLVLQGPPGSGKTWIAQRLARLFVLRTACRSCLASSQ